MITAYLNFVHEDKAHGGRKHEEKKVALNLKRTDEVWEILWTPQVAKWFKKHMEYDFKPIEWTRMSGSYALCDPDNNVLVTVTNDKADPYAEADSAIGCDEVYVMVWAWVPDKKKPKEKLPTVLQALELSVKRH